MLAVRMVGEATCTASEGYVSCSQCWTGENLVVVRRYLWSETEWGGGGGMRQESGGNVVVEELGADVDNQ